VQILQRVFVPIDVGNPDGRSSGLVIGFGDGAGTKRRIQWNADVANIFEVLATHTQDPANGFLCRCPLRGRIIAVDFQVLPGSPTRIVAAKQVPPVAPNANGLAYLFSDINDQKYDPLRSAGVVVGEPVELWVRLRGDFLLDAAQRAIDAEFVRGELPTGDRAKGSKHGIQGGLFESWMNLQVG
jgi:hypothetical protein